MLSSEYISPATGEMFASQLAIHESTFLQCQALNQAVMDWHEDPEGKITVPSRYILSSREALSVIPIDWQSENDQTQFGTRVTYLSSRFTVNLYVTKDTPHVECHLLLRQPEEVPSRALSVIDAMIGGVEQFLSQEIPDVPIRVFTQPTQSEEPLLQ